MKTCYPSCLGKTAKWTSLQNRQSTHWFLKKFETSHLSLLFFIHATQEAFHPFKRLITLQCWWCLMMAPVLHSTLCNSVFWCSHLAVWRDVIQRKPTACQETGSEECPSAQKQSSVFHFFTLHILHFINCATNRLLLITLIQRNWTYFKAFLVLRNIYTSTNFTCDLNRTRRSDHCQFCNGVCKQEQKCRRLMQKHFFCVWMQTANIFHSTDKMIAEQQWTSLSSVYLGFQASKASALSTVRISFWWGCNVTVSCFCCCLLCVTSIDSNEPIFIPL